MLKIILDKNILKYEAKEKVIKYAREHSVDKTVIMTVAGATNCKIDYNALAGKGDVDMCTLFEEIARESEMKGKIEGRAEGKIEGRAEGKIEGRAEGIIETGFDCGLSENDILERLQNKLDVSLQMAQEYLKRFGKQKKQIF